MPTLTTLARKAQRKAAQCRPKAVSMPARPTDATVRRIEKRMKETERKCDTALREARAELAKLMSAANDAAREAQKAEEAVLRKEQQALEVKNINARRLNVARSAAIERNERARKEKARIAAGGKKRGRKPAKKAPARLRPVDWSKLREEYKEGVVLQGDSRKGPVKVKKAPAKKAPAKKTRAKKTGKA